MCDVNGESGPGGRYISPSDCQRYGVTAQVDVVLAPSPRARLIYCTTYDVICPARAKFMLRARSRVAWIYAQLCEAAWSLWEPPALICAISVALTFTQLIVSWRGTLRHRDRSWNRVTQVYRLSRASPHLTARAVSEGWWCILCETSDEVRRRSVTVPATQQVQMSVSEFLPPTLFFSLRHFRHFSVTVLKLAVTVFASVPFFDMMTEFT